MAEPLRFIQSQLSLECILEAALPGQILNNPDLHYL